VTDRDFRPSDPLVERAVDALRALPAVDRARIARVVAAAARRRAEDTLPDEDDLVSEIPQRSRRAWVLATAGAAVVLIAAGVDILVARGAPPRREIQSATMPTAASSPAIAPAVAASASSDAVDAASIPTQFVYDGTAHRVALVGDFNGWDERATPLVREPGSALWSVTVPLQRGRHVYAFIVDSTWTTDRRAPVSRDPDFGVEGSVIIVGRP
jgi:AMP-activated protein kinase-like protein